MGTEEKKKFEVPIIEEVQCEDLEDLYAFAIVPAAEGGGY